MSINSHLFKLIFEASKSGMVILGKRGELLHYNNSFCAMVGKSSEKLVRHRFQEFLKQEDRDGFESDFNRLTGGTTDHLHLELRHPSVGDYDRWWLVELTRERDDEQNKQFIFGIIQDITADKEGQQKLINDKELAERATRIKSDFLANMSHEIRTPIHTIIGMNELLQETKLDAEQQEYAEQVKFAADVLLSLINDILDFSKIEAGKLTLENIDFDLHNMVEDAVDLISLEAHKKGLEAALYIEQGVPTRVIGDPVRLRQIIVNLFNNAIKFTKEGEIVVVIKEREELEDEYVLHFEVEDTGIGIEKEKLGRLFQAFSQVDTSTTRKFGGTGLGLSISKNLVHMMNGQIGVDSHYEEGSTFWFDIHLGKTDREEEPKSLPESYDSVKALVVDDNDTARWIARSYLEELGGVVEEALNGSEALEKLKSAASEGEPFNLCVVDLLMPGMDGWQFASEVNADKMINSAKLVLLSPTGKSGEEAKMKLLGWYDAYLSKPIKKGDFYETLLRIMSSETDLEAVEEVEELKPEEKQQVLPVDERHGLIMVAEDHEVNQTLFKTILENLGNEVHLANNGVEAVEGAEKYDYSIIFMDVQMPEMNGYEATEKIREKGITTPIIAATASGIKSEQDKCYAVGMNDILLKPFKKKDITPLLDEWLPSQPATTTVTADSGHEAAPPAASATAEETAGSSGTAATSGPETSTVKKTEDSSTQATATPEESGAPVAEHVVSRETAETGKKGVESAEEAESAEAAEGPSKGISQSGGAEFPNNTEIFNYEEAVSNFMGKEEVVVRVVQSFIDKVHGQLPAMTEDLQSGDMEKLREEAHSIKGGAWNLEIKRVGDAAKALEDSSRESRKEDSKKNFEVLKQVFNEFLDYVAPLMEKAPSRS